MKYIKYLLFSSLFFLSFISCNNKQKDKEESVVKHDGYMLPRVLILTTGTNKGSGVMAEGIILASQMFNKNGAFVTMNSRDVLLNKKELNKYNIIIIPTAAGYHDADRQYSLTFMSNEELKTIKEWIYNGGLLIAGDNVGRNLMDATDRTSLYGELTPGDWPLAESFGISLIERNMQGYRIDGEITPELKGNFVPKYKDNIWALTVDTIYSDSVKVLANWIKDNDSIPALIQSKYGNGYCFLLPTFYLLHPANAGGYWSTKQINEFYDYVLKIFNKNNRVSFHLNIWPNANDYAFCATLNANGSLEEYNRVLDFFKKVDIKPSLFVNDISDSTIKELLKKYTLQSNGFSKIDHQIVPFYDINRNIKLNEIAWNKKFTGYRFPYTRTSYWGFECLSELGYEFDSSIGVDNLENYVGCAFPYNIPVSNNSLYKYVDMLEISPIMNDDYYFYERILTDSYADKDIKNDAQLYGKYLKNFWQYAIVPYNGLFVYLGHPVYIGHSDSTMVPLQNIIKEIQKEKTWITTIEDVSKYWNQIEKTRFYINEKSNYAELLVLSADTNTIKNVTVKTAIKLSSVSALKGECKIIERNGWNYVVFDAFNNQKLTLKYE
ncbi:MAG TPA: hypothetical protein PLC59_10520 [Bacteroidales bacterium]|nr:hypothetical protein [Bacteroidales bacterium]